VIADFGLSKLIDKDSIDELQTQCGTPGYVVDTWHESNYAFLSLARIYTHFHPCRYMAPEVILRKRYGKPVDMWSIGVMSYFLLCGYTPFDLNRGNEEEERENVLALRYSFNPKYWGRISADAKDFISKLLVLDPKARLTAESALQHPWLLRVVTLTPSASTDILPHVREGNAARKSVRASVPQ
jgi:calcium/calmodulin-dependent protein kinase I